MAMHFTIITPLRTALETEVVDISVPATEGIMEILPGHADLITSVSNGELTYRPAGQEPQSLFIGGGFLQVEHDQVLLVTDTALAAADIDSDTVEKALKRAQDALKNRESVLSREEQTRLEAAIAKQLAMLEFHKRLHR